MAKKFIDTFVTEKIPDGEYIVCAGGVSMDAESWCQREARRLQEKGRRVEAKHENGFCWVERT